MRIFRAGSFKYLRRASHGVLWAGKDFPGTSDKEVLERAEAERRILFTLERDFWQMARQRPERMRKGGLALIRVHPAMARNVEKLVRLVLSRGDSLVGQASLVTQWGIEILPAGRSGSGPADE